MNSGIYMLTFTGDLNKVYIGKSVDIRARFRDHCNKLKTNNHKNYKLQNAYSIYGLPLLSIIQLISSDQESIMYSEEVSWIREFNAYTEGYNLTIGGDSGPIFKGEDHANCRNTKEQLIEVFDLLCDTTLTQKEISNSIKVPVGVVERIAQGVSHRWLKDEYPERYAKLISIDRTYKRSESKHTAKDRGVKYPALVSPEGVVHDNIENLSLFARTYNLQSANLHKLFKKERGNHKGWHLQP